MYERYCKLRDQKGLKDSDVARGAGVSKSTFSDWKSGRSDPKIDKLSKIADFFGVKVDYFSDDELIDNEYYLNDETAKAAQEIFENKELKALFDVARDADPEDLKALHNMALALKRKERGEHYDSFS